LHGRALTTGRLRPDFAVTDFPMMMRIMVTVSSMSRDVRPQLWRRYAEMLLDAAIDAPASSRESEPTAHRIRSDPDIRRAGLAGPRR